MKQFSPERKIKNILPSSTYKITTGCGSMHITICYDNREGKGIKEILVSIGKGGTCAQAQTQAISSLLSAAIRAGADPRGLAQDLIGIKCRSPIYQYGEDTLSCGDAIGKFLISYLENPPWTRKEVLQGAQEG